MNEVLDLYGRHAPALYRYALALCGNRQDAEDLVADTFVRLWTTSGVVREETVRAYLFTILRNLHRTRRRRAGQEAPLDQAAELTDGARPVDEQVEERRRFEQVRAELAMLADSDRRALLMRVRDGRSYEDIAALLGVSPGAARVRVHRARARLTRAVASAASVGGERL
jgi:RNA polymerase sigma-70 factor, ECF subfamily